MKAIKINVQTKSFDEIEINDWKQISESIGNGCRLFEIPITFKNNDSIYVDEESLCKDLNELKGSFIMEGWSHPLFGNGIILGHTKNGDSVSVKSKIEDLKKEIVFLDEFQTKSFAKLLLTKGTTIISF